jgi:hypothetical protein
LLDHEPGVFQQAEMPRNRRTADRQCVRELLDRALAGTEELDDRPTVRVAERIERIPRG